MGLVVGKERVGGWREGRELMGKKGEREREMGPRSVPLEGQIENLNEPAASYLQKGKLLNRDQKPRGLGAGRPGKMQREVWSQREQPTQVQSLSKELPMSEASSLRPFRKTTEGPRRERQPLHSCYTKV